MSDVCAGGWELGVGHLAVWRLVITLISIKKVPKKLIKATKTSCNKRPPAWHRPIVNRMRLQSTVGTVHRPILRSVLYDVTRYSYSYSISYVRLRDESCLGGTSSPPRMRNG